MEAQVFVSINAGITCLRGLGRPVAKLVDGVARGFAERIFRAPLRWDDVDALGQQMRAAWARFAHTGSPGGAGAMHWPKHEPGAGEGRWFGLAET
jgi:hypothetical protein